MIIPEIPEHKPVEVITISILLGTIIGMTFVTIHTSIVDYLGGPYDAPVSFTAEVALCFGITIVLLVGIIYFSVICAKIICKYIPMKIDNNQ